MQAWSRKHTLITGVALILLTNAVALLGVAWNRSGDPESMLKLTQRELHQPNGDMSHDNSGMALKLAWRVAAADPESAINWSYAGAGGTPEWLDEAKMASLGFDLTETAHSKDIEGIERRRYRELSKEVLLVLELAGPAYEQFLESTRRYAVEAEAKIATNAESEAVMRQLKDLRERVTREDLENSRLFVVDAGLDMAVLRKNFPDRSRYAIVRGQVLPWSFGDNEKGKNKARGYIEGLSVDSINVPSDYRAGFEQEHRQPGITPSKSSPFEATVAFGQRLEPWIIDVSVAPK